MPRLKDFAAIFLHLIVLLPLLAQAAPKAQESTPSTTSTTSSSFWLAQIQRQGTIGFGSDPNYKIFRNVKDYGAVGMDNITPYNQTMDTDILQATASPMILRP